MTFVPVIEELNQRIDTGPIGLEEWQKLKPCLNGIWPIFYQLLWETGIRVSEGLNLKNEDLKPGAIDNFILVTRLKKRTQVIDGLPISKNLMNDLIILSSGKYNIFSRTKKKNEKTYSRITAYKQLENGLKLANMERKLHPHSFRHGFAKRIAEIKSLTALDSLQLIKKALNLSSINYATRYSQMSDVQAINILKKLND